MPRRVLIATLAALGVLVFVGSTGANPSGSYREGWEGTIEFHETSTFHQDYGIDRGAQDDSTSVTLAITIGRQQGLGTGTGQESQWLNLRATATGEAHALRTATPPGCRTTTETSWKGSIPAQADFFMLATVSDPFHDARFFIELRNYNDAYATGLEVQNANTVFEDTCANGGIRNSQYQDSMGWNVVAPTGKNVGYDKGFDPGNRTHLVGSGTNVQTLACRGSTTLVCGQITQSISWDLTRFTKGTPPPRTVPTGKSTPPPSIYIIHMPSSLTIRRAGGSISITITSSDRRSPQTLCWHGASTTKQTCAGGHGAWRVKLRRTPGKQVFTLKAQGKVVARKTLSINITA